MPSFQFLLTPDLLSHEYRQVHKVDLDIGPCLLYYALSVVYEPGLGSRALGI